MRIEREHHAPGRPARGPCSITRSTMRAWPRCTPSKLPIATAPAAQLARADSSTWRSSFTCRGHRHAVEANRRRRLRRIMRPRGDGSGQPRARSPRTAVRRADAAQRLASRAPICYPFARRLGRSTGARGSSMEEKQFFLSPDLAYRLAAIDIGTNSIRLIVAEPLRGGNYRILDEEKESTRLGEKLSKTGRLDPQAIEKSLARPAADEADRRGLSDHASSRRSPPAPCAKRPTATSSAAGPAKSWASRSKSSAPSKRPCWPSPACSGPST